MAKIFAISNQKGGVGKTTTAINLSAAVASKCRRVLLIDLDPQGNSTSGLGIDKKADFLNIYHVLIENLPVEQASQHKYFRIKVTSIRHCISRRRN